MFHWPVSNTTLADIEPALAKHPVDGMNPFVYDQIADFKREPNNIDAKEYITKALVSKKDFR